MTERNRSPARRQPPPARSVYDAGDRTLTARPPPSSVPMPAGRYRLDHYRKTRFWAVHEGDDLLVVTVYKRGARAVVERLQALDRQLAAQHAQAGETNLPRAAEAASPEWQARASRPPEQLPLFSLPDRPASRRRRVLHGQRLRS